MLGIRLTDGCCRGRALWHPFPRASGASEGGNSRKAAVFDGKAADAARGPDSPCAAGRTAGGADRLLCTAYTAAGGKPCAAASCPPCGGVCVLCGMRGILSGCSLLICVLATPSDKAVPYFGGGMQYGPAAHQAPQGLSGERSGRIVDCKKGVPLGPERASSSCALLRKLFCPLKKPAKAIPVPPCRVPKKGRRKPFARRFS